MQIKAVVIDFDKTITSKDLTDLLAEKVGKKAESEELNQMFFEGKLKGLSGLIQRINFFQGISIGDLEKFTKNQDGLRKGAIELFQFFKQNKIVSIIASGSIVPLLEIYQKKLGANYVVGSQPKMKGNIIDSISEEDFSGSDFKAHDTKIILDTLNISPKNLVAIGDSPADKGLFELAAISIAINPQGGIEKYADYVIHDDLALVIPILKNL